MTITAPQSQERWWNSAARTSFTSILRRCLLIPVDRQPQPEVWRSEEHTSELQSRENLVCRLLLETSGSLATSATTPRTGARLGVPLGEFVEGVWWESPDFPVPPGA